MSYEPGKMGAAEGTVLVFMTTFSSFFLSMWSVVVDRVATAAWLVPFIGAVVFITMFMLLLFVMERVPGDLYEVTEKLLGKMGARLVTVYLIAVFYLDAVLLIRQFGENTLLTAIPDTDICLVIGWYALIAAIAIYIGIEAIARSAVISLPFALTGLVLLLLLLYNKFNLYNLSPWLGNGLPVLFTTGIFASGFYFNTFLLAILAPAFQNLRTIRTAVLLGIGLSTFFRLIGVFAFTGIFSVAVGREKVLPFFEMARLIHINRFIQRVESFFIILWVIFGIVTIAINLYVAIYLLTRLFNLPSMRPLILPLLIITAQLALLPPDIVTTIELHMKVGARLFTIGVFVIPVVLLVAALIKGKKKAQSCAIN